MTNEYNLFSSPPSQLNQEFRLNDMLTIRLTPKYKIPCVFVSVEHYQSYLEDFTFEPFVSYSFSQIGDTIYMCIVSQNLCILFISKGNQYLHYVDIIELMTNKTLFPVEENDIENLYNYCDINDNIKFVDHRSINRTRANLHFIVDFYIKKYQIVLNESNSGNKEFTVNDYLNFTIRALFSFYIQRNFYPNSKFKDPTFLEYDFVNEKKKGEAKEKQQKLHQFRIKEFLKLYRINISEKSDIFLGFHIESEIFVAIKIFRTGHRAEYLREKNIYEKVQHYCIMKCYGYSEIRNISNLMNCLIFPLMSNDSLRSKLNYLTNFEKTKITIRILFAIDYLHSKGIMHRDIKPDNILLDNNMEAYLSDFDSCQSYLKVPIDIRSNENKNESMIKPNNHQRMLYSGVGTRRYMAPENYNQIECSFQSDLFSFGMLIYQLATCKAPFSEDNELEIVSKLLKGETPDLNLFEYGPIVRLYNICRSLKITGRTATYYLIQIMKDSCLFFKDENFAEILDLFAKFNFFRGDTSINRADVCFLIESAAAGDINSRFLYGKLLHKGINVTNGSENNELAFEIFLQLAKENHLESIYKVGHMMYKGYGETKYCSFSYFKRASKRGHSKSMYFLANCYLKGIGCDQNTEKAINWLITSTAYGCAKAQYHLAVFLVQEPHSIFDYDVELGHTLIELSTYQGYHKAMNVYGNWISGEARCCITTSNVENSIEDLQTFQQNCAKISRGITISKSSRKISKKNVISKINFDTKKEGLDIKKFHMIKKKARETQDGDLILRVYYLYIFQNKFEKAMKFIELGKNISHPKSMFIYGSLKEKCCPSYSMNLYIAAANEGCTQAMVRLAQIHLKQKKQIELGIQYLRESIENKSRKGFREIGYLYYKGKYLPENKRIACDCFIQSTKYSLSQYYLGKMYEKGIILPKNKDKAIHFYRLAATDIFRPKANRKLKELTNGKEEVVHPTACSIQLYQIKYPRIRSYHCFTCQILNHNGVCAYCAKYCHEGHDLEENGMICLLCDCKQYKTCKF